MEALHQFDEFCIFFFVKVPIGVSLVACVVGGFVIAGRIKKARREGRNWFQVSLTTLIAVVLTVGCLATANVLSQEQTLGSTSIIIQVRGWPFHYWSDNLGVFWPGVLLDSMIGTTLFFAVLFGTENMIRQRRAVVSQVHGTRAQGLD